VQERHGGKEAVSTAMKLERRETFRHMGYYWRMSFYWDNEVVGMIAVNPFPSDYRYVVTSSLTTPHWIEEVKDEEDAEYWIISHTPKLRRLRDMRMARRFVDKMIELTQRPNQTTFTTE
jgi:hypothetical protein